MFDLERRSEWVWLAVCLVVVLREALSVIRRLGWPGLGLDLLIVVAAAVSAQLLHRRRHLALPLVGVALVVGVLGPARGTVTGQALFLWGALVMIFLSRHGGKRLGKFWAVLRARLTFRWKKPVMSGARPIPS